jgi:excisionase family DNA binding protein
MMLKLNEVAERLNCSVQNVYSLIDRGVLDAFRIGANGKGYRVSEEQLSAFLNERREHRGKDAPSFSLKCKPVRLKHLR